MKIGAIKIILPFYFFEYIIVSWGMVELVPGSSSALLSTSLIWGFFFYVNLIRRGKFSMFGTRSVTSPLPKARNSTVFCYRDNGVLPSVKCLLNDTSIHEELLGAASRVVFQICFLYFCRIGELLNAKSSDIVNPDRVALHGSKHSNSYIIYLPGLSNQVSEIEDSPPPFPLFQVPYIKLYRDAIRVGIRLDRKNCTNNKRLHSARYQVVSQLDKIFDDSELPGILRHKSSSSFLYYKP